uniref:ADAM metallopeptidase domain 19b n=1 Tax=Cyprinodon variegatus TaxID=28743 RepID=A0A3Q2E563_CYPVA
MSFSCSLLNFLLGTCRPLRSLSFFCCFCNFIVLVFFVLTASRQLLAPGYQEIRYTADGSRRSASPATHFQTDVNRFFEFRGLNRLCCHFHRGLISLNTSVSYLIEPLPDSMDAQQHAVFRAESLRLPGGSCTHHHGNQEHYAGLGDFIQGMVSPQNKREKREVMQNMKYVELLLVADRAEMDFYKTQQKLLEAANLVDKYYKDLKIRVALIGLEVWTDKDQINVSNNPHSTLAGFLTWRRKMLKILPNDNAQLVTSVSLLLKGSYIPSICASFDHSPVSVGVAATIAHEMGHNFGMNHDRESCCKAKAEDGGCIMAAATGSPFPRVFNDCNQEELNSYLNSGGGKCLFNLPHVDSLYGGQRCGNGYLEKGEECDCGEEKECTSPCCNANNCTLKAGAECAHGVCCHNCKIKSPGELCRATSGLCDLPEFCDGKSESCPANFYLADGTSCAHGRLCNNNQNCHCDPGWAPPWCNHSGPGGSVDSGPPKSPDEESPSHLSPLPSARPRQTIKRPAMTPPPVPYQAAEQKEIRKKNQAPFPPAASSPQGQKPRQVSPTFPIPPSLPPQDPKRQLRPDPPRRPPPPCPVSSHFPVSLFKQAFSTDKEIFLFLIQ